VALYVLELSSFQLETTASLAPAAATVLNVSADHMDRYATLEAYAAAKARIFANCRNAVINLDQLRKLRIFENEKALADEAEPAVDTIAEPRQHFSGSDLGRDRSGGFGAAAVGRSHQRRAHPSCQVIEWHARACTVSIPGSPEPVERRRPSLRLYRTTK